MFIKAKIYIRAQEAYLEVLVLLKFIWDIYSRSIYVWAQVALFNKLFIKTLKDFKEKKEN